MPALPPPLPATGSVEWPWSDWKMTMVSSSRPALPQRGQQGADAFVQGAGEGGVLVVGELEAAGAVFLHPVRIALVRPVGRVHGEVQEERPFVLRIDEANRLFHHEVGEVLAVAENLPAVQVQVVAVRPAGGMGVVVDDAVVVPEAELEPLEVRGRLRRAAQMPLADERGAVAVLQEHLGHGDLFQRQLPVAAVQARDDAGVVVHAGPLRRPARQQRRPGRRTQRRAGIELGQHDAFAGQPVEVRRLDMPRTVHAHVGITLVVGEDDEYVGFRRFVLCRRRQGCANDRQGGQQSGRGVRCALCGQRVSHPSCMRSSSRNRGSPSAARPGLGAVEFPEDAALRRRFDERHAAIGVESAGGRHGHCTRRESFVPSGRTRSTEALRAPRRGRRRAAAGGRQALRSPLRARQRRGRLR